MSDPRFENFTKVIEQTAALGYRNKGRGAVMLVADVPGIPPDSHILYIPIAELLALVPGFGDDAETIQWLNTYDPATQYTLLDFQPGDGVEGEVMPHFMKFIHQMAPSA